MPPWRPILCPVVGWMGQWPGQDGEQRALRRLYASQALHGRGCPDPSVVSESARWGGWVKEEKAGPSYLLPAPSPTSPLQGCGVSFDPASPFFQNGHLKPSPSPLGKAQWSEASSWGGPCHTLGREASRDLPRLKWRRGDRVGRAQHSTGWTGAVRGVGQAGYKPGRVRLGLCCALAPTCTSLPETLQDRSWPWLPVWPILKTALQAQLTGAL